MKIGFFTNNYLPRKTGVAHSVANFQKGLQERGHKVYIFAPEYKESKNKKREGVYRYPSLTVGEDLSSRKDSFLRSVPFPFSKRLREKVRKLDLDIIHSHHPFLLGKEALRIAKKENLPLLFSLHTPYQQYLNKLPAKLRGALKEVVLKRIIAYINKSDLFLIPTKKVARPLLKKKPEVEFRVVPDGVELKEFSRPKREESRKEIYSRYELPEECRLLLSVSRLTFEKNVSFLIESLKHLKKEFKKEVKLLLIGSGQKEKKLKRLAKNLGLREDIIFAGEKDHERLPTFYRASDLFVFSSLVETQGLVLVEAMAAGLPVVALKEAAGTREVMQSGRTGFLVEEKPQIFARKCRRLLVDKDLWGQYKKGAKKEAQKYSVETCTERLLQAYQDVI